MTINNSINAASYPNNGNQIFVAQSFGNDANTGSYFAPFATFGAALTAAYGISAETPPTIIGLDNAFYDEQLVLTDTTYIHAPYASISSSSGDTITFNGDAAIVTFHALESTAGNPVTCNSGTTTNNTANFYQSLTWGTTGFQNTSTGTLILNFTNCVTPLVATSGYIKINGSNQLIVKPTGAVTGYCGGQFIGGATVYATANPVIQGTQGAVLLRQDFSITSASLASAAHVVLLPSINNTNYLLTNILLNKNGVAMGGSGARNLVLTDGFQTFTTIPTADLTTLTQAQWGTTAVPYNLSNQSWNEECGTVYALYSGGTADYTSGTCKITLVYSQLSS